MKHRVWATAVLLCSLSVAQASNMEVIDLSDDSDSLGMQMQTYYKHPDVKRALDLSVEWSQQPMFETNPSTRLNGWLWGAQVLQQNPKQTKKWCKTLKEAHPEQHIQIAPLFQFAQTKWSDKCLKSLNLSEEDKQFLATLPDLSQPLHITLQEPSDLDILWTTYFATGNPKVLYKLVDFIVKQGQSQEVGDIYITALWSLKSNMAQDETVRETVTRYIETLNPSEQQILRASLSQGGIL